MQLIFLSFITLFLGALESMVLAAPSPVPVAYTCPPTDGLNYALGVANYGPNNIFCAYPLVPGSEDTSYSCTYAKKTGKLVVDNDDGLCAPTAVSPLTRRNMKVAARNPLPTRPQPKSGSIPAGKPNKRYLKKKRD